MKDAMTDHKAEWVERMLGACVPGGSYCDPQRVADAIREYCAARAAAPAASEGEDGAVLWISPEDFRNPHFVGMNAVRAGHEQHGKHYTMPLYTRPAAQVAAEPSCPDCKAPGVLYECVWCSANNYPPQVAATPKHDEGREDSPEFKSGFALGRSESEFLCGLIADPKCDRCGARNPAEAESMCRPSDDSCPGSSWPLENLWNLATQPAARRVTDGPLAQPLKAEWTPDCSGKQDFDADLIALSTRYWPRGGGYLVVNGGVVYDNDSRPEVRPSAKASILAQGDEIASAYFEADSEAEVKAQVEQWATQQWDRIRSALAESFAQPAEGVSGE